MQEHREGSVGAAGRSPGMEPPVTDGDGRQAAAAAPSVGKITLKIRRPGSDGYDESWFAEHVDRQPTLREPVASLDQVSRLHFHFGLCTFFGLGFACLVLSSVLRFTEYL